MTAAATEAMAHAFRVDGLHERQRRAGSKDLTAELQLRFLYTWRAEFAKLGQPKAVQMLGALIASVKRADQLPGANKP